MHQSTVQLTGSLRRSSRLIIILTLAVAMFASIALTPVVANAGGSTGTETGTGDELEAAREKVTGEVQLQDF